MKAFPAIKEREEMRKVIGRYGLTGRQQVSNYCNKLRIILQQISFSRSVQFVSSPMVSVAAWCLPISPDKLLICS